MKSVESIVEEHNAQERRYQLLQASAMIFSQLRPGDPIDIGLAVGCAEALLAEIERRDAERRQP